MLRKERISLTFMNFVRKLNNLSNINNYFILNSRMLLIKLSD